MFSSSSVWLNQPKFFLCAFCMWLSSQPLAPADPIRHLQVSRGVLGTLCWWHLLEDDSEMEWGGAPHPATFLSILTGRSSSLGVSSPGYSEELHASTVCLQSSQSQILQDQKGRDLYAPTPGSVTNEQKKCSSLALYVL